MNTDLYEYNLYFCAFKVLTLRVCLSFGRTRWAVHCRTCHSVTTLSTVVRFVLLLLSVLEFPGLYLGQEIDHILWYFSWFSTVHLW